MDELTRTVAERLRTWADNARPSPGLQERILNSAAARRQQALAGAAACLVAGILLPMFVLAGPQRGTGQTTALPGLPTRTESPAAGLSAPDPPEELRALLEPEPPVRIPVRLDALHFRADALGEDGAVLGGTGFDADPYRATDHRLWLATPSAPVPAPIAGTPRGTWARAAGIKVSAWAQPRDDRYEYQLMCVRDGAPPRRMGDTGVTKAWRPVHISAGLIVWTDEADVTWLAAGCRGEPRRLLSSGFAVAFAHPHLFVIQDRLLRRVDVRDGSVHPVVELPGDRPQDRPVLFAATPDAVIWVARRNLVVFDWRQGRSVEFPVAAGLTDLTDLTAGDRLVVLAARPLETDPGAYASMILDPRSGRTITLRSEAYAAGPWLLWRQGQAYSLARVTP